MAGPGIAVGELLRAIDAGEPLVLLDVRNEDDLARWRIEGMRPVETVHVPYFDFLEDAAGAIARLPRGQRIAVVCAKGGSSEMVVDVLAEAGVEARNVEGGMAAWAAHHEPVRASSAGDAARGFEIWQIHRRAKGCLSYVVRAGPEAAVVDPSRHVEVYEDLVRELGARIALVLDTHVHADHLSGGLLLSRRAGAPYFVGSGDAPDVVAPLEAAPNGWRFLLGETGRGPFPIEVIAAPGHTPGSAAYRLGERHILGGDTLFVGGVGRPDLGGDAAAWARALHRTLHGRLSRLPDEAVVLPAHTTGAGEIDARGVVSRPLGELRRTPAFRIESEAAFVAAVATGIEPPGAVYASILHANRSGAAVVEDVAAEWETGRNLCAASAVTSTREGAGRGT